MSEDLRYEKTDQQFNDLPMPDEETSWQKMKEMLDDDDDNIVPPPVFLKSCLGWGILLLVGLTIAWLIVRHEKWWAETEKANQTSSSNKNEKKFINGNPVKNTTKPGKDVGEQNTETNTNPSQPLNETDGSEVVTNSRPKGVISPIKKEEGRQKEKNTATDKVFMSKQKLVVKRKQNNVLKIQKAVLSKELEQPIKTNKEKTEKIETKNIDHPLNNQPQDKTATDINTNEKNNKETDTVIILINRPPVISDSIKTNADQPKDSLEQKTAKPKQKKLLLAAGIGEQQLVPIAGQTTVPYSRYGRKSSLADYVPSVFVQLQKERKWFVQTEFRYGAAQSVKELSYNQNTKYDAVSSNVTTTTMRLKKTYYHQLPASFNYFLVSNLSIGVGGIYSHFYGAITEKEITTFNTQTQAVSSIKQIIPVKHFTDSFLYKTQVHALLQADYHWKKFSFGLRYTKDIQPYIKYTKPDGTVDEEKNQSLQFIIRYRLWQSAKL